MELFSTFEVEKILGTKRSRFQDWIDRGFITPYQKASGKGSKAQFTREDMYTLYLFQNLVELGLEREMVARIVNGINFPGKYLGDDYHNPEFSLDWDTGSIVYSRVAPGEKHPKGNLVFQDIAYYDGKSERLPVEDYHLFQIVINLKAIQKAVDGQIG